MKTILKLFFFFAASTAAVAGDYSYQNGILYERYVESESYWYCGRQYTRNVHKYRPVLKSTDKDWRDKALEIIDRQKERESFEDFVGQLGIRGMMSRQGYGYGQQSAALYPSQTGSTLGAFTAFEYSRYGSTSPLDVNKAQERIAQNIDQYSRVTSEQARRSTEALQDTSYLIDAQGERLGAIAELQETRVAMREVMRGLADQTRTYSELMQAMKPKDSETIRSYSVTPGDRQSPRSSENEQPSVESGDAMATLEQFCGKCHGADLAAPKGGLYLDAGVALSAADFYATSLRLNPQSPWMDGDGNLMRMPPEGSPQPTDQQRPLILQAVQSLVKEN